MFLVVSPTTIPPSLQTGWTFDPVSAKVTYSVVLFRLLGKSVHAFLIRKKYVKRKAFVSLPPPPAQFSPWDAVM